MRQSINFTHISTTKRHALSLSLSQRNKFLKFFLRIGWKSYLYMPLAFFPLCLFSLFMEGERLHPGSMNFQRPREVLLCFTKAPEVPQGSRQPHSGHIQG